MSANGSRQLCRRVLAAVLAMVLSFGGVPVEALAEVVAPGSGDVVATQAQSDTSAADGQDTSGQDASGQDDAGESAAAPSSGESAAHGAAGSSGSGTTASDGAGEASGATPSGTANLAERVVPQLGGSSSAKSDALPAQSRRAAAAASATATDMTFSSYDNAYIEASTDATGGYDVTGSIEAGTTVYAHVYDSFEDDRIEPSADWTYQWYALSYQYGSVSDDNAIAGATSESFTPTEDLAGKYLRVKVTCSSANVTSSGVGPVKKPLAAGAVKLGGVDITGTASVGQTLTATVYTGSSWNKGEVPAGTSITYTWRSSDSKPSYYGTSWTTIEGATGSTLELTEALKGKYISVVANAGDNDVTAGDSSYSPFGPVLGEGEVELYSVKLVDVPSTVEVGTTLTAQAYAGTYSTQSPVTQNVTYTWRYADTDPSSYSFDESSWTTIEGQTGPTLTVGEELQGKYLSVTATAGANTVELSSYSAVGPVKLAGAVDIYSAYVTTSQDAASGTAKYTAADTLWAQAKEKGASETIDPEKLGYQWQVSDDNSTWTDIEGATDQSLALADYAGRYIRCQVSAKVGTSTYSTRSRNAVAPVGTVDVGSVALSKTGSLQVGDTLTAAATDQDGNDVTGDSRVVWQWYASDTSYGTGAAIEGATTSTLDVTQDLLGKYVTAHANGSNGAWSDVTSSQAGPVKVPGAVTLHHVEASGKAVVGGTVTAQAYTSSYYKTADTDTVLYQWQYADTKTTNDVSFLDIPGATGATYTIPESFTDAGGQTVSLLGKYLRVKATSDGSVVSTSQKSYYGSTSVEPLGPVSVRGGYDLTGVNVSSDRTNAQVGATLSAVAQYQKQGTYSSYDADVPDDAEVTYTWYAADDASGTNRSVAKVESLTGATASTLTLTSELAGRYVWVEAVAKMAPATSSKTAVAAEGAYDLHHVNLSPSSGDVLTGSEVSASVYASQLGKSTATEVTGRDGVSVQWYVASSADAADGEWTAIDGATGATLTVPASAAGRYLRAVATSGSSSVSATFEAPVVDSTSLQGAVALLNQDYGWRPTLTYGTDNNINDVLLSDLAERGFDTTGVTARVKDVEFQSTNASAEVAIANEDSARNGEITYFYIDPSQTSSWSITGLHTVKSITFELSRDGQTVEYTPSRTFQIPWNEARLQELLQQKADEMAIGYTDGDSAESVTGDLTLPYKAGTKTGSGYSASYSASWTSVAWESNSDAVAVSGYGWSDYKGTVARGSADQQVTLTASVTGSSNYDMPTSLSATRTFDVTVKADPDKVAAATADLQAKLDANFTWNNVKDFSTGADVDQSAVTGDLQMPRTNVLGIDGKDYTVAYSSTSDLVTFNGYHGQVVRPLDGDATAGITLTVTSKANPEITASKTIDGVTIKSVAESDIDSEVALLQKVEAAYKDALLGSGTATSQGEPAKDNLSTFQKAYLDADGNLVFARSVAEASGHEGIVPVELPGYDSMGSYDQARLFKSSNTDVVLNETLQLAWNADRSTSLSQYHEQSQYNTQVTVSSRLASERFGSYYEKYKDDASVDEATKTKLQQLAGEDVSADINIAGTTGKDELKVSGSIIGQDSSGTARTWATLPTTTYDEGTTAEVAVKQMLDAAGLAYEATGEGSSFYLSTITKGDQTLGWDASTGKYWQFFVNGEASSVGVGSYVLQPGDVITLAYSAWGDDIPTPVASVTVTGSIVGQDEDGYGQTWSADTTFEYDADKGATAADVFQSLLENNGLSYEAAGEGSSWYLSTITKDGHTLGWDASTGKFWQFFVNGEAASVGAGAYVLQDGDTVTLAYSKWGDPIPATDYVNAKVMLLVVNDDGTTESWLDDDSTSRIKVELGSTAEDVTKTVLDANGIGYDDYLLTFTRNGRNLGWNEDTGQYWNFYVNGEFSESLPSQVTAKEGDTYTWIYQKYQQETKVNDVEVHPEKVRPTDIKADWASYRNADGNTTKASTPTQETGTSWIQQVYVRQGSRDMSGISEPILVDGKVFVAVQDRLEMRDVSTGEVSEVNGVKQTAQLATTIDSTCRMIYADGIIIVPLHDGMLQAITPDDLTTVWIAPSVDGRAAADVAKSSQQSLSTLTVDDGCVYVGTSDGNRTTGYLRCVRLSDGKVMWTYAPTDSAYYWSGAAATPDGVLVAQNTGELDLVSKIGENGRAKILDSITLGSEVRSTVVVDGDSAYVMGYDGMLYKVTVRDGKISDLKSVKLGTYSISTPTIADGKVYVGGTVANTPGALYVLDSDTLAVEHVVTGFADGTQIKGTVASSPLVATHDGATYVYFTANDGIGGAYFYKVGDQTAQYLYIPKEAQQQYGLASLVPDSTGALYFINDSGNLFKLGGTTKGGTLSKGDDNGKGNQNGNNDNKNTNENGGTKNTGNGGSSRTNTIGASSPVITSGSSTGSTGSSTSGVSSSSTSANASALTPFWLIGDADSDDLDSGSDSLPTSTASDTDDANSEDALARRNLPIWPIIGMVLGVFALVLAIVWRRRRQNDENEEA